MDFKKAIEGLLQFTGDVAVAAAEKAKSCIDDNLVSAQAKDDYIMQLEEELKKKNREILRLKKQQKKQNWKH